MGMLECWKCFLLELLEGGKCPEKLKKLTCSI